MLVKLGQRVGIHTYGKVVSYHAIGGPDGLLARRMPFRGNSMSAHYNGAQYVVLSYNTVVATAEGGVVFTIDNRWGPTSGRHINLAKAWL